MRTSRGLESEKRIGGFRCLIKDIDKVLRQSCARTQEGGVKSVACVKNETGHCC